jgi:hypothetical protein
MVTRSPAVSKALVNGNGTHAHEEHGWNRMWSTPSMNEAEIEVAIGISPKKPCP